MTINKCHVIVFNVIQYFLNDTVETLIISKLTVIDIDSCHIKYGTLTI